MRILVEVHMLVNSTHSMTGGASKKGYHYSIEFVFSASWNTCGGMGSTGHLMILEYLHSQYKKTIIICISSLATVWSLIILVLLKYKSQLWHFLLWIPILSQSHWGPLDTRYLDSPDIHFISLHVCIS